MLPKLVQTIAPSIPFPVFNPEGEPGTYLISHIHAVELEGGNNVMVPPD